MECGSRSPRPKRPDFASGNPKIPWRRIDQDINYDHDQNLSRWLFLSHYYHLSLSFFFESRYPVETPVDRCPWGDAWPDILHGRKAIDPDVDQSLDSLDESKRASPNLIKKAGKNTTLESLKRVQRPKPPETVISPCTARLRQYLLGTCPVLPWYLPAHPPPPT